jgi:hypothetical protein
MVQYILFFSLAFAIDRPIATAPEEHMSSSLTMKELELASHSLKQWKSLGPDGVTNDMLRRLGPVAKSGSPQANEQQLETRNSPTGVERS